MTVVIHKNVCGRSRGQKFVPAMNRVINVDAQLWHFFDGCGNDELVIIFCGKSIFDIGFEYGKIKSLRVKLRVGQTNLGDERGACDFKPRQIISVINDAHRVGFGKSHDDFYLSANHKKHYIQSGFKNQNFGLAGTL